MSLGERGVLVAVPDGSGHTVTLLLAPRLAVAIVSAVLVVAGVRIAVTRRLPRFRLRPGRPEVGQRPQPVRVGGGVALAATSLLLQQVVSLVPMPFLAELALMATSLLVAAGALGWFVLRQDQLSGSTARLQAGVRLDRTDPARAPRRNADLRYRWSAFQ
ncbi:hypothetical protein [Micromonospora halophytica]|nr:hypothetical protein [Micromonospora halophytica]